MEIFSKGKLGRWKWTLSWNNHSLCIS